MYFGDEQPQEMDFQAIADAADQPQPGDPQEPYIGGGGNVQPSTFNPMAMGKRVGMPGFPPAGRMHDKTGWMFDPQTGKPIGGGATTLPVVPGEMTMPQTGWDFWGSVGTLLGDQATPEDIAMLKEVFASDPTWKAPTSAKAQRLIALATSLQKMGYTDEATIGQILGQLFDMGYRKPAFSLSMFSRLLEPYGLGVGGGQSSARQSGGTDISALLGL
jgi:hypothetical protein